MLYPEQSACQLLTERRLAAQAPDFGCDCVAIRIVMTTTGASAASAWCARRRACTTSSLTTRRHELEGSE